MNNGTIAAELHMAMVNSMYTIDYFNVRLTLDRLIYIGNCCCCFCWILYICKIKVLSVHWSKSRQILVAHVSSKAMIENTFNKIPVCLSVYMCMYVCSVVSAQILITIYVKTDKGIIMKFHIWIRCDTFIAT